MRNTNIGILTALLVVLSTGIAEATVAGESLPISLYSRDTTPLEQSGRRCAPRPRQWRKRLSACPLTLPPSQGMR